MLKKIVIFLALFVASGYGIPAPPEFGSSSDNIWSDEDSSSDEDMSDGVDTALRKMWDDLMSRVKNVTFKVINVPADEMVVKSVCGPVSCLYDVVNFYNMTLPVVLPQIQDDTTVTFDTSDALSPETSSIAAPVSEVDRYREKRSVRSGSGEVDAKAVPVVWR